MVPSSFTAFFAASAGAAAALIGLLFVAVSVRPEKVFGEGAEAQNTLMASASFTALLNAFFISLGALIPGANLGLFVLILGPIAILNSTALGIDAFRQPTRAETLRSLGLVLVALVLYGYELWNAIRLMQAPGNDTPVYNIAGALLGVYVYGVARTWQLLGANRRGVLSLIVPWLRHASAPSHEARSAAIGTPPPAPTAPLAPSAASEIGARRDGAPGAP